MSTQDQLNKEQETLQNLSQPLSNASTPETRVMVFKVPGEEDLKLSLELNWGVGVGGGLWSAGKRMNFN